MDYALLGYIASGLIILSLLMKNIRRLRIVNLCGCSLYVIYGFLISSSPVIAMNGICVFINLYYIVNTWREQKKQLI